jgi:predicted DNA-binding protein (UPF0251 family)
MADFNKDVESLQDELGALRSIASDVGKSLREAFKSPDVTNFKKEALATLATFTKIDKVLGDTSISLDKALKKEISKKELLKEITKLSTLESKIQTEIVKIQQTANTSNQAEINLKNELLQQLGEQLRSVQEQKDKVDEVTKAYKEQNVVLGFLKEKSQSILKNLTTAGIFKFFIDAALKANTQTTQLGKSLSISAKAANSIRQDFVEYSRVSGNTFINTDRLLKAQTELSEQLGIAVQFSGEELETFSRLTEIVGLTAQEAGNLAKFSAAAGITSKDYVKQARTSAFFAQQTNKIHISDKELLSSISKLSAGITTKFQNNPKALAEAVIQAKQLGLTLEQVDKTSESLLNFETSIENELKAELITSKQLNFERARAAALTGDQATLMQEIASQAGSLADFQKMNIIAQKSLAEAFGMSREEMADMLIKQEAIAQYGDEAAKLNKDQLEDMKRRNMTASEYLDMVTNQRSVQERFNDAMLKLQDIIGNLVAGPLGQMLNIISSILENTTALAAIMGGAMVLNFMKVLTVMKQAKKISYGAAIIEIIKSAYQSIGGLPGVGMILAGAAAAAGISYLASQSSQQVEDGIAMPGRGPFTITDSYGATAITAAGDGLAVSPNINRGENNNNVNASFNLTPMISAINEVRVAIDRLYNKDQSINMDGKKVGTTLVQNTYKLA